MRPTDVDFRSPKVKSGEYVYPNSTCDGRKIFGAFQQRSGPVVALALSKKDDLEIDKVQL